MTLDQKKTLLDMGNAKSLRDAIYTPWRRTQFALWFWEEPIPITMATFIKLMHEP